MDSVIKNGAVVTAAGVSKADVGIEDGKVVAIGASLDAGGARTIDAVGCYVIPGGVDVHTHLDTPGFNARTADDFATGTRAAACGGTTTIVDFCQQDHGQSPADALGVWHENAHGTLELVSSDHAAWSYETAKILGRDDFTKIPNGAPGIEERMMMVYQGVNQGRLTVPQFVEVTATRPAQIFGLFPRKGTIAVGSDADLVIWDPKRERTIRQSELHHAIDYSLYEGMAVRGGPRTVMLRGELLVENEAFVGRPGSGQFLRRDKYRGRNTAPARRTGIANAA